MGDWPKNPDQVERALENSGHRIAALESEVERLTRELSAMRTVRDGWQREYDTRGDRIAELEDIARKGRAE